MRHHGSDIRICDTHSSDGKDIFPQSDTDSDTDKHDDIICTDCTLWTGVHSFDLVTKDCTPLIIYMLFFNETTFGGRDTRILSPVL